MKKYFNRNCLIVLLIALTIAGVSIVSLNISGSSGLFSNVAGAMTVPLKKAAASVASSFESLYGYMYKYDALAEENAALESEIAQFQQQNLEYAEIAAENERLHTLLGLKERNSDYKFDTATVIGHSASNWSSSFTISKGSSNSEVAVGDCIINESGMLIGRVTEVGYSSSTAISITDTTFSAGAVISSSGDSAVISGDFALMRQGKLKLDFLTSDTELVANDTLVTSGKGGGFPKGLVVGYVDNVYTNPGGLGRSASVTPAADLENIIYVYIITDFEVTE